MAQRRHLSDLYVVGEEVTFDDGGGDPVSVYVRKLNPVEHDKALRYANGARAKAMAARKDRTSDDYLETEGSIAGYERSDLIEYLVEDHKNNRQIIIEAELAAEEEWTDNDYLEGLRDAWSKGVEDAEESARVKAELDRFAAEVTKILEDEAEDFSEDLEHKSDGDLRAMVVDKMFDVRLGVAWLTEFRRCEIWLSTRDPEDRRTYYFEDRQEIDDLPLEVLMRLQEAYRELSVEPTEGKDSRATDDSSTSSVSPANPDPEKPSGPEAAAA